MCPTGEIGILFDRSCWQLIYCTWLFCDISPEENIDLSLTLLKPNSIRSSICGWGIICCIAVSISSHQRHIVFVLRFQCLQKFSNHLQVGYISHHLASRAKTPRGFLKIDPGRCMDCWACPACTFENLPTAECCEICEKGRRGQRKTMGNAQEVEKSLKHIEIPFFVDILVCLDIWD